MAFKIVNKEGKDKEKEWCGDCGDTRGIEQEWQAIAGTDRFVRADFSVRSEGRDWDRDLIWPKRLRVRRNGGGQDCSAVEQYSLSWI